MFPDEIEITTVDASTNLPVGNVAVSIKLFANRKNDYGMLPFITNERGIAIYTKQYVKGLIDRTIGVFPMDYSSPLHDCKPVVEIGVLSSEEVSRAIYGMTMWKEAYKIPQQEIDRLLAVDNKNYIPETQTIYIKDDIKLSAEFKLTPA